MSGTPDACLARKVFKGTLHRHSGLGTAESKELKLPVGVAFRRHRF